MSEYGKYGSMQSRRGNNHDIFQAMEMLIQDKEQIKKTIVENKRQGNTTEKLEKDQLYNDALMIQTVFPTEWESSLLDSADRVLALLPKSATCNIIRSMIEENFLLRIVTVDHQKTTQELEAIIEELKATIQQLQTK